MVNNAFWMCRSLWCAAELLLRQPGLGCQLGVAFWLLQGWALKVKIAEWIFSVISKRMPLGNYLGFQASSYVSQPKVGVRFRRNVKGPAHG